MQGRTVTKLAALAMSVMPVFAAAQGMEVNHYSAKGFVHNTYWSAHGATAFLNVAESSAANQGRTTSAAAFGYALISTPTGFISYVTEGTDSTATVVPSNSALRTPGIVTGSFTARRMEYAFGPFGLQMVSMKQGTIVAQSTLQNPTLIEISRQPYHNHMTLPGLGLLFSVQSTYHGKFGFHPTGTGGMVFLPTSGGMDVIVPNGTATDPASWMGHFHSAETEIIRP